MGRVISMGPPRKRVREKRRFTVQDYVRGQQILANAIFHWRTDDSDDARAAVRFLVNHLATRFRADDAPLEPNSIETVLPANLNPPEAPPEA